MRPLGSDLPASGSATSRSTKRRRDRRNQKAHTFKKLASLLYSSTATSSAVQLGLHDLTYFLPSCRLEGLDTGARYNGQRQARPYHTLYETGVRLHEGAFCVSFSLSSSTGGNVSFLSRRWVCYSHHSGCSSASGRSAGLQKFPWNGPPVPFPLAKPALDSPFTCIATRDEVFTPSTPEIRHHLAASSRSYVSFELMPLTTNGLPACRRPGYYLQRRSSSISCGRNIRQPFTKLKSRPLCPSCLARLDHSFRSFSFTKTPRDLP